jgi:hypothetical protein
MSDDCHIWTRGTTGNGYPAMKQGERTVYVKRVLWELLHGPIPEGKTVRSRCGNRRCVNPEHLYLDRSGRLDPTFEGGKFASGNAESTGAVLDG